MKRRDFRNSSEPKDPTFKKGGPYIAPHPAGTGAVPAQTSDQAVKVDPKSDLNKEEDKKKRPERAHYVPKKIGNEEQENLPENLTAPEHTLHHQPQQQHDTATKSRRKNRNKNNKSKENKNESQEGETDKKPDTIKPHHSKEKDTLPKSKKDKVNHEQGRTLERKREESKQGEGKQKRSGKDKEFSNHNSERRKDPANNNQRDSRDDISFHRPAPPSSGEDSYYRSSGSRGAPTGRSTHRGGGRGNHHNRNRNSMNYDSRDDYSSSNEYSTKSLPWRQGGGGRGSRRSSPSSRNSWRDAGSRHSSRPGSRANSPRSSRGNSPFRSRPHSRQSSNGQPRSPVFARRYSPHHGKRRGPDSKQRPATRPRTPSPIKSKNKRDSRDLDGWTRGEVNRKEDVGVSSYHEAKPPTGRIKSAPPFTNSEGQNKTTDKPPRLDEKPKVALSRKESESFYSDWSQEIEEEEERSLSIEPPPITRPDLLPSQNRAGVLRLVPEHVSNSSSPHSQGTHAWAVTSNQGMAASSQGWATSEPRPRFSVPGNQMLPGPPQGQDQHRYLFDPNNPSKPIVMEGEPSRRDRQGFAYQSPPGVSCRFPVNLPRYILDFR